METKTQPETIDRHKLQQSMCEIYETDWGFTALNQVCMLALCSYKNYCFSNIRHYKSFQCWMVGNIYQRATSYVIKNDNTYWGLNASWRNASWNVLKQVWRYEECRNEEPVVAEAVARHRVGMDSVHLKMEQAYMAAPRDCHGDSTATNPW